MREMNRRSVLKGALGGLAGLALAPFAANALAAGKRTSAEKPATARLNDKLALISGVGGNVVALAADDGVLLVDTGAPESGRALMSQLRALPGRGKVHTVFNTHYHIDHTGSNEVFGKGGARIVAHEKTKQWLAVDHWIPAEERYEKARAKQAVPTETFYTTGKTSAAGEQIEYGYLMEAHTAGDAYVFFKDSNVLVVGDAVASGADPVLDWFAGGWVGGRVDSQDLLLKLCNDQTRIVPGSGPLMTKAQLQAQAQMTQKIYDRMVELVRKGFTDKDMLEAGVLEGLGHTWTDAQAFMYAANKGFWAHHNTLSHDVV
jgi:glyoxylase-like metal-dependent hydrolase (beta-lactamase superfamily II)